MLRSIGEIEGWFSGREGLRLAELAGRVSPAHAIVEVGAYQGRSTAYLAAGAMHGAGAHVTSIDPWGPTSVPGGTEQGPADEVMRRYLENLRALKIERGVTTLRAEAAAVAAMWIRPVGLLFVDSTHYYLDTVNEIEAWEPHVVAGGFAAFHDYDNHPAHEGVRRATDEAIARGAWQHDDVTKSLRVLQRQS